LEMEREKLASMRNSAAVGAGAGAGAGTRSGSAGLKRSARPTIEPLPLTAGKGGQSAQKPAPQVAATLASEDELQSQPVAAARQPPKPSKEAKSDPAAAKTGGPRMKFAKETSPVNTQLDSRYVRAVQRARLV